MRHEGSGLVRGPRARQVVAVLGAVIPTSWKPCVYRWLLGWDVHPGAVVGLSLFLGVDHARIGEGVRIGHGNVFRNVRRLSIGDHAEIGQFNWFSAGQPFLAGGRADAGILRIGTHGAVTSRHYVDCSGGVEIGEFALVAGVRSVVLTHFIDVVTNRQKLAGVHVGDRTMVSSNVTLLPGAEVPPRSQVAAGAVVRGVLKESRRLYAGVPANPVREVRGLFFDREVGHVEP